MNKYVVKNKKTITIILLMLVVTIGYAILSTNIVINGTSNIAKNTWDVHFENIKITENSVDAVTNPNLDNDVKVDFEVDLKKPGDFFEFSIDLVNEGTLDAMLESIKKIPNLTEEQSKYLDYTVEYQNKEQILQNQLVKSNEFVRFKVRIEHKKDVLASDLPENAESIKFSFSGNYIQSDDTGIEVRNNGIAQLINFKLNDTTYQAEDGMTWDEWLISPYNTSKTTSYIISDGTTEDIAYENVIVSNQSYSGTKCELSGGWIFNDVLDLSAWPESGSEDSFIDFVTTYSGDYRNFSFFVINSSSISYSFLNSLIPIPGYATSNGWQIEKYKMINFGTELQNVSKKFYLWFLENATPCNHIDENHDEVCDVCHIDYLHGEQFYSYALILDNSANSTENPTPMVFVKEAGALKAGDWYNSEKYGTLKILYVYDDVDNTDPKGSKSFPSWYPQRKIVTSVFVEDSIKPKTTYAWFYDMTLCNSINVSMLNTILVKDMSYMYYNCEALTKFVWFKANPDGFRTTSVVDMSYMFYNCKSLNEIDLIFDNISFDTSNVVYMSYMFANCSGITELDIEYFVMTSLVYANGMFENCTNLATIYSTTMNFSNPIENAKNMFLGCTSLVGKNNTTYNSKYVDGTYARVDGGESDPGYFSTGSCVTGDTLVTLADGSKKRIDSVTHDDYLMVWDSFNGEFTKAPAAIVFNHGYKNNTIIELKFSDNTVVKVVNIHQFMDLAANKFVSITKNNVKDYIGHKFAKRDGNSYKTVKLVDYDIREERVEAYGIISAYHYNVLVEDMLSTDFMIKDYGLFNYFEYGQDLTFDKEKMQKDIEKYGLYTYEDFKDYLTYEQFVAFNAQYMKVSVGKGYYTYDRIISAINQYLK